MAVDFRTNFDVRRPPFFNRAGGSGGAPAPPVFPGGVWGGGSPPSKTIRPKFRQISAEIWFFGSVFQPLSGSGDSDDDGSSSNSSNSNIYDLAAEIQNRKTENRRKFGGISDGNSCWGGSRPPRPPRENRGGWGPPGPPHSVKKRRPADVEIPKKTKNEKNRKSVYFNR